MFMKEKYLIHISAIFDMCVSYRGRIFHRLQVSTAAPQGFCCFYCGRDIITTSPPLMMVYHQRKAINTNVAMLTSSRLSTDLIAALAGCCLLSWRRTSHYQRSWHTVPYCVAGVVFNLCWSCPSEASLSPALWPTAVITLCTLSGGNHAPAAHKWLWVSRVESAHSHFQISLYSQPNELMILITKKQNDESFNGSNGRDRKES